ncbi:RNA-directed DNA polymerase, eukaryota [Tanacetum coccineum]
MGEVWVMLEFGTEKSMKLFRDNVSVGSWFSQINQASMDFVTEGRIAWVELEGIPFKVWSGNTFKQIAAKWGVLLDIDDQKETCFHSKRLCIHTKSHRSISEEFKIIFRGKVFWIRAKETPGWVPNFLEDAEDEDQSDVDSKDGRSKVHESGSDEESDGEGVPKTLFDEDGLMKKQSEEENMDNHDDMSEDLFRIYSLLKKKDKVVSNKDSEFSMKYPPGFIPNEGSDEASMHVQEGRGGNSENGNEGNVDVDNAVPSGNHSGMNSKEGGTESVCSGHFKKSEVPRTGGSIMSLLDDVVKVGQVMGYKMDGCLAQKAKKDWVKELCVKNKVNFLALQETKMENMKLFCVKTCWGNMAFDYVHSDSVDYFIMVHGVWQPNGKDVLIIVVYAPHDLKEKMMLWDYLTREIGRWKGEVVVMGDFNEVRNRSDRFGSVFNVQGTNVFDSFIYSAGLVKVSLGGCSFTWCHKSATKISKLDRFLVSESLLNTCPNISAITLERYMSDHRPILLREYHFDYGPTPFRFFHYWFEMEGFSKIMEDTWKESSSDESNAMISMMGKLKFLKTKIREWNKTNMLCRKNVKAQCKADLEAVEVIINTGNGNEEIAIKRTELVKNLQYIDKLNSLEIAQKAKVKWAIEGDENSSFFHGMLNKKRNTLSICGIMVDGIWIDDPNLVKRDFLMHFSSRFSKPDNRRALILMRFPKRLSLEQQVELESEVSNEEIKRVVWDCRSDKAPGPDGFTFGFYRYFWYLIENDELIQWCKRKKKQFLVFKVDFEKAYDSVRASGLRINMSTSKLMGLHVDSDKVKRAAIKLGCLTFKTPFTYLESTVGGSMSRIQAWEEVVERVKSRLFNWKMKTLSIGGRLTLLKSVLGSMSIFHMSIFKVPLGVLRKLESIRSHYFNGHDPNCNKASWVNWKMVLAHKDKGGLGVSSLFALNRGLMFKWIWRFYTQDTFLWVRVIKAIYGEAGNMDAKVKAGPTSCWMSIVHEAKSLVNKCIDLFKFMHFKLGNGENARFWEDRSRSLVWPFRFKRSPRGGVEQEQFEELVMLVHDVRLVPMSDQWSWTLANSGEFSVASVRQLIDDKTLPEVDYKTRWIKYVPIKVNVLAWKVKSNSLPTRFNVSHRGILIDSIKCGICDTGGGNV